jgi:hypothetical protein
LKHAQYDVMPTPRNGHCLFLCFVDILRERGISGAPQTYQAMRDVIADYCEKHNGAITYEGVVYPCDEEIRANGYGGITEILAFTTLYNISVQCHSPETPPYVQLFSCGDPGVASEMLLHTLGWQDDGNRASGGDHWQRLRNASNVFMNSEFESNLQVRPVFLNNARLHSTA